MVEFTRLGLLFAPFLFISLLQFRWILTTFVISIPWKTAVLFHAVSHAFTLPEVAILLVAAHLGWHVLTERPKVPLTRTSLWLIGFGAAATVSVLMLLLNPPVDLFGRPYGIAEAYGDFTLTKISFSMNSITQLALRWFFVGATVVFGLSLVIRKHMVEWTLRVTVFNAIFVGFLGVLYQYSQIIELDAFPETLQILGFNRFPLSPGTLGPLPRMYSITGEPGVTAHFLLFAFAITLVTALTETDGVFHRRSAATLSVLLFGFLFLTTGATGYGGLIVLVGVLLLTGAVTESLKFEAVMALLFGVSGVGLFVLVALLAWPGINVLHIMVIQAEKLLFSAQSGSLRAWYISQSLFLWSQRPLFGAGVGTQNGTSFLASTLAETGLVGGLALFASVVTSYRSGVIADTVKPESHVVASAVAAATVGIVAFIARSLAASLFPWLWVAIALSGVSFYHSRSTPSSEESI